MKKLVTIFLLFISAVCSAAKYYVSSAGDDGNTGTSPATAWKTITKLNIQFAFMVPGDSVFLNRGDTLYGKLSINRSGAYNNPIVVTAYGTGAAPVITGLSSITNFSSAGGNLWTATISSANNARVLTKGNTMLPWGRYPNYGYIRFQNHTGTSQITSSSLTGTPDFTGSTIALRVSPYELSVFPVSSQSAGTLFFTGNTASLRDNYGFFLQNSVVCLDTTGEWTFNNTTKLLTLYSTSTPTGYKISTIDSLIVLANSKYITWKDVVINGANSIGVTLLNSSYIIFDNCTYNNNGKDAVRGQGANACTVQNCVITNSFNNGLNFVNTSNDSCYLLNNYIKNSGHVAGMNGNGTSTRMMGIAVEGNNNYIYANTVDSSGYVPITLKRGSNNIFSHNRVFNYCFTIDDGGGLYYWNVTSNPYLGNKFLWNIVTGGIGATASKAPGAAVDVDGIYMDDWVRNVEIAYNTVYDIPQSGMYIHNDSNLYIHHNLIYNSGKYQVNFTYNDVYVAGVKQPDFPMQKIVFTNNILVSRTSTQLVRFNYSARNNIDSFGVSDSNIYARPINDSLTIQSTRVISGSTVTSNYSLYTWRAAYPKYDSSTKRSPVTVTDVNNIRFEKNTTLSPVSLSLGANYTQISNGTVVPIITVPGMCSWLGIFYAAIVEEEQFLQIPFNLTTE
jgi:hypothetical protein